MPSGLEWLKSGVVCFSSAHGQAWCVNVEMLCVCVWGGVCTLERQAWLVCLKYGGTWTTVYSHFQA